MNAIRQIRSAACPSLTTPTDRRATLPCLPTAPHVALACRWRLEADGRLSCTWEPVAPLPHRRPQLTLVPKDIRSC